MFSRIAPRYDLLNTLLSWGRDEYWRQRAIDELSPAPGEVLVDLCCGTAEMSLKAV
ncbi:bifunctional demethylmenaquinone methyltransferase/2-methoxy-6-polyprenyl-1,4-benzoquinol methylase, partial [bacterium (candidate division B38) B3_B38]